MLAAFVIVIAGMRLAAPLVVSFLLAGFIAVIWAPLFLAMQRRGIPSGVALLVILVLIGGFGLGVVSVLDRSLAEAGDRLQDYGQALDGQARMILGWLTAQGIELPAGTIGSYLDPALLLRWFGPIANTLTELILYGFIILIVAIFILLESALMPDKVRALPGLSHRGWARIQRIVGDVRHYMLLKTVMSALTGLLAGLFVGFLGLDFPILLGTLAFALNYVPNIGSIAAALPALLLAFIQIGPAGLAVAAIGYVVINVGVSNGIEPRFMGPRLGLSPLVVLTSVIFWGWVLGPLGMLLSVPLTMTVKIALESDENTRWMALLMSAKPPRRLRPPARIVPARLRARRSGDRKPAA
jgi:AI-2 transport protein TqsA